MASVSQSVDSLLAKAAPYSVKSSFSDGEFGDAVYSGDMSGPLWKETNQMGKEQFLNLLMTQLKYQDPLDPMENSAFVAQLAQFSQLETGQNTVSALEALGQAFNLNLDAQMYASQSVANSSAMSLIGREVRMRQVTVSWDGGLESRVPINIHLGNADKGVVEIRNANGDIVRTIAVAEKDAQNSATVYWDGKLDDGTTAKPGNYLVGAQGGDKNSSLYTYVQSVVEGVRFTTDGVLVKIDGREISIGEVLDVSLDSSIGGGYISQASALSLMGKVVRARHDTISHAAVAGAEHCIYVNGQPHTTVTVEIKNASGTVVATLHESVNEFGYAQLFWDGFTDDEEMAKAGQYKISVVGSGANPSLYAYTEGVVDGLTSLSGDFKLKIGSAEIALNSIISISAPNSSTPES
ncbi:MAG: hypothetical protein LBH93_01975 [Chitinispirillales bacterium]|jgi:flagellar basal-body rod modification protein FlgD|nr:hypothetical protein [Chitinispirillales bacterium]